MHFYYYNLNMQYMYMDHSGPGIFIPPPCSIWCKMPLWPRTLFLFAMLCYFPIWKSILAKLLRDRRVMSVLWMSLFETPLCSKCWPWWSHTYAMVLPKLHRFWTKVIDNTIHMFFFLHQCITKSQTLSIRHPGGKLTISSY